MFSTVSAGRTVAGILTMRRFAIPILAAACLLTASSASAVTVDQIVALSKAGVSEAVILALIDRDRSVLTIDPEQIVSLKREGLSDTLITAMLQSGRDEAEQAAREVSSWNAAAMLSSLNSSPEVVVVGHGPDRPNTIHTEDWYAGFRDGARVSGYRSGFTYPLAPRSAYRNGLTGRSFRIPAAAPFGVSDRARTADPALCLAQVNTASGPGPSYVTACPAAMQRSLKGR